MCLRVRVVSSVEDVQLSEGFSGCQPKGALSAVNRPTQRNRRKYFDKSLCGVPDHSTLAFWEKRGVGFEGLLRSEAHNIEGTII